MDFSKEIVYVNGPGAQSYMTMFKEAGFGSTSDPDKASIIVYTGGADVNPALYGEKNFEIAGRGVSYFDDKRDERDAVMFGIGCANQILHVGICRGGQFLNVMNEGSMWQHVNGHAGVGEHELVDTVTDEVHMVTSTHHQMMRPGAGGQVLAVASKAGFKVAEHDSFDRKKAENFPKEWAEDVEVIWYPDTKCLCFQPHPEHPGADSTRKYFFSLLERILA